jgi:hypothetical protein
MRNRSRPTERGWPARRGDAAAAVRQELDPAVLGLAVAVLLTITCSSAM